MHAIRLDCLLEGALAALDTDLIIPTEEVEAWQWVEEVSIARCSLCFSDWQNIWAKMWISVARLVISVSIVSSLLTSVVKAVDVWNFESTL